MADRFEIDVRKAMRNIEDDVETFVRRVNTKLFTSIIKDTPVDTGRARGNWQTTETVAARNVIDRKGKGPANAEALTVLNKGIGLFWLSNNLPYISVLEFGQYGTGPGATVRTTRDGYSIQAPYGMVRKNVARLKNIIGEVK
jgi:hypothetical protein